MSRLKSGIEIYRKHYTHRLIVHFAKLRDDSDLLRVKKVRIQWTLYLFYGHFALYTSFFMRAVKCSSRM